MTTAYIGEKVKNIRELKNLTQDYMAIQLSITQSFCSRSESDITFSRLQKIASTFVMNVEDI